MVFCYSSLRKFIYVSIIEIKRDQFWSFNFDVLLRYKKMLLTGFAKFKNRWLFILLLSIPMYILQKSKIMKKKNPIKKNWGWIPAWFQRLHMLITAFIWGHMSILNMPEIKIYTPFGSLISQRRKFSSVQFSSVTQSCLTLCDPMDCTPGLTVHHQLSITNPRSSLKLMSMELVMPSNQLILRHPLLLLLSSFPSIRVFSNESVFTSGGQSIELSDSASSFQWIFRTYFLLDRLVGSPCSSRDSRLFCNTTVQSIISSVCSLLYSSSLTSIHD